MKTDFYVEVKGEQTDCKKLTDMAKEIWKAEGRLLKDLESMDIYFKPEEKTCYYVINNELKGHFEL